MLHEDYQTLLPANNVWQVISRHIKLSNLFILISTKNPANLFNDSLPVGWGCRIHRLLLCRGVRPPNECSGYDSKRSDGEVPVMLNH